MAKETEMLVELPIIDRPIRKLDPHTNASRHVDVALSSEAQRRVLRHLYDDLQGKPMQGGGTVKNSADVIRYLLDCVAESAGLAGR